MARTSPQLTTFNAGEWDPLLWGRPDLAKYPNACRRLQNFIPKAQGPAGRRPGTHHVTATKDNKVARLIPFEFSTLQAYQVEATDLLFRFYRDRGIIVAGALPVELATPYTEAMLAGLQWAQSADILYLCQPTLQQRLLARTSHISWTLSLFDFLDGPYQEVNTTATTLTPSAFAPGAGVTVTASSTTGINGGQGFLATDVGRLIRVLQTGVWGYAKITGWTSPTVVTVTIITTWTSVAAKATWRLGAWSDTTGWPQAVAFFEERLWFAGTVAQPQTKWGSVSGEFSNFAPSSAAGVVSDDSAVSFTISDAKVNAIRWLSAGETLIAGTNSGPFEVRATTLNEAITPTNINARRVSTKKADAQAPLRIDNETIFVSRGGKQLHALAYRFDLGNSGGYVAPELSLLSRHLTAAGVAAIDHQEEPDDLIWAALSSGLLVATTYMPDQQVNGWHRHPLGGRHVDAMNVTQAFGKALSLSVIPGAGQDELWLVVERRINGATVRYVEYLEYEFAPINIDDKDGAWFVDSGLSYDGSQAAVLTYSADAAQIGNLDVPFASSSSSFASVTPGRQIHVPYVIAGDLPGDSRLGRGRAEITAIVDSFNVRCRILTPFPAAASPVAAGGWRISATQVSGLDHLEGETVQVLADGAEHPDRVVAGGLIQLASAAGRVQVGLACPARLETVNLETGNPEGAALGKAKRLHKAAVKFVDTVGARVGFDDAHLDIVDFREAGHAMDESPPLFTGDKVVEFPKGFDREARVLVTQDAPLPCTVAAIVPTETVNAG